MKVKHRLTAVAAVLALTAGTAQSQNINFTTTGAFTGTGCATLSSTLTSVTCGAIGGVALTYSFGDQQVLNGFGNAQFGTFTTTGLGPSTFSDVLFTLTINQTSPTAGTAFTSAPVYGTVSAIQGGLIWGPVNPTMFSIDNVNYTISTDAISGGVRIDPPGVNGAIGSPQTIRGFVSTTVPEPGTSMLLMAGVAALGLVARRRNGAS